MSVGLKKLRLVRVVSDEGTTVRCPPSSLPARAIQHALIALTEGALVCWREGKITRNLERITPERNIW